MVCWYGTWKARPTASLYRQMRHFCRRGGGRGGENDFSSFFFLPHSLFHSLLFLSSDIVWFKIGQHSEGFFFKCILQVLSSHVKQGQMTCKLDRACGVACLLLVTSAWGHGELCLKLAPDSHCGEAELPSSTSRNLYFAKSHSCMAWNKFSTTSKL